MRDEKSKAGPSKLTLAQKAQHRGLTTRRYLIERTKNNLREFLHRPLTNISVALLILLSVTLVFVEFLLPPGPRLQDIEELNNLITWIFVLELSLRYWVAPNKRVYLQNYWVDILSVLPIFRVFRTLRVLRLLRILRFMRAVMLLMRQSGWISQRMSTYFGSFGILFVTAVLLVFCASLALVAADGSMQGEVSAVEHFVERVWETAFLFISGEIVHDLPDSHWGRLVWLIVSISGLVIFAIMVGLITASMSNYFKEKMDSKELILSELSDHVIVCGWDRMGVVVLKELETVKDIWRKGVVVVAQTDIDIAAEAKIDRRQTFFHIRDDFTKVDVLEAAGARHAKAAIVLADKGHNLADQDRDARTVLAALTLEKLNPKIFTCAELLNEDNALHLKMAGVEEVISRTTIMAGLFASTVVNAGITPIISDILTHRSGSYIKKLPVPDDFVGKTIDSAITFFKSQYDALLLGLERNDTSVSPPQPEQQLNPPSSTVLQAGDQLLLVVTRNSPMCELDF